MWGVGVLPPTRARAARRVHQPVHPYSGQQTPPAAVCAQSNFRFRCYRNPKVQINKTDANDALGLAQIVRTGWHREVAVKGMDAHALRLLLVARSQLVSQRQAVANTVRGLLKAFGLRVPPGAGRPFAHRVRAAAEGNDALLAIAEPMLLAWQALREQVAVLHRRLLARAKADEAAKRLMTVPGVGVVVSLACTAVIDDPARFKRSSVVGAYLGLTPRRQQSSETDRTGRISKCCDGLFRAYLFEAATVLLTRHPKSYTLKEWGLALARRSGLRRAKVAVARKLAVVMHSIWKSGEGFRWPGPAAAPVAAAA